MAGGVDEESNRTIRLNHRLKRMGHVLSGRYKAPLVEGSGHGDPRTACDYAPRNPVRAKLLKSEDRLRAYPWSSFGYCRSAPEHPPPWMRVDRLLGEYGIGRDTAAGRQPFDQTPLSIKAIAARGQLGTSNPANVRLHRAMKQLLPPGSGPASIGIGNEGIYGRPL